VSLSHTVIAIDGPAASGKSSVAKALARRLGYLYVNTGAMYRAATWYVLSRHVPADDAAAVADAIQRASIECGLAGGESTIRIDGEDGGDQLVSAGVNDNVSRVARVPEVRAKLVAAQREYVSCGDLVMEGRDIGSAVFPDTPYKFYIDASTEVRAQRRARQGLQDSIAARDKQDSSRPTSPLVIAEDAHVIDSSHLTIDGVVGEIIGRLKLKGLALPDHI
jgi:cytidylate kinase